MTTVKTRSVYEAIGRVQKKIGTLTKNAPNPYFDSTYVDHASLVATLNPALEEEGLVLTCAVQRDELGSFLECRFEYMGELEPHATRVVTSKWPLPSTDNPQKYASATTYARRYAPICVLNLPCVDDDGNFASGKSKVAPGGGVQGALDALKKK